MPISNKKKKNMQYTIQRFISNKFNIITLIFLENKLI